MKQCHRVIGIDLGTCYTTVSAWDTIRELPVPLCDPETGQRAFPSVVAVDPRCGTVIVGETAKALLSREPMSGASDLIHGLDKCEPVQLLGDVFQPHELVAFVLMKCKDMAERHFGEEVNDAVLTVPQWFTSSQKEALKQAALLAGLYPRQFVPSPVAAVVSYSADRFDEQPSVCLVYDLGSGTEASTIAVQKGRIDIIACSGELCLGGTAFDDAITRWALGQLQEKYQLDVGVNPRGLALIKQRAEQAKIRLSNANEATLDLLELDPQRAPLLTLTRQQLEVLIGGTVHESLAHIDAAIDRAAATGAIHHDDITAILMMGGSSNVPLVGKVVEQYAARGTSSLRVDRAPESIAADGAAILAHRFVPSVGSFNPASPPLDQTENDDVNAALITEHSIGIAADDRTFIPVIEQGMCIPVSVTRTGLTNVDGADHFALRIFAGEGTRIDACRLKGEFRIGPIDPKPAGYHRFELTLSLDVNGELHASVLHVNESRVYQWGERSSKNEPLLNDRERLARRCTSHADAASNALVPPMRLSSAAPSDSGEHSRIVPGVVGDRLSFTVTSPVSFCPCEHHEVDVWAHLLHQKAQVIEMAREQAADSDIQSRTRGPSIVTVGRGSILSIRLRMSR